jgi:hypothetical protein
MPSAETQLRSFIARFEPAHQKLIRSIRNALRKRFPTANELAYDYSRFFVIAYSPTDRPTDAILSIAGRADGVDLYLNHGPRLPDPKKLLRGSGKQVRFIRLESARHLAHPDVAALIAAAMDHASVPFPRRTPGQLIIKTNKSGDAKKRPRRKSSARAAVA